MYVRTATIVVKLGVAHATADNHSPSESKVSGKMTRITAMSRMRVPTDDDERYEWDYDESYT